MSQQPSGDGSAERATLRRITLGGAVVLGTMTVLVVVLLVLLPGKSGPVVAAVAVAGLWVLYLLGVRLHRQRVAWVRGEPGAKDPTDNWFNNTANRYPALALLVSGVLLVGVVYLRLQ